MAEFHLFRLKTEWPQQRSLLFPVGENPQTVIEAAINEKPSGELRKDHVWHIGNIVKLDDSGLFFALGRVTKATTPRYDEEEGNFKEEALEEAPYTYVFLDTHLQVCAIAKKTRIAPKVSAIATNLKKLLCTADAAKNRGVNFTISEISNPEEFIQSLQEAHAILRFTATFSRPNPFDVEQDFHRPLENLHQATEATSGKTELKGPSLNQEVLTQISQSIASTGDTASARVQMQPDEKPVTKYLKQNPAVLNEEELATDDDKKNVLAKVRELYRRIRGTAED